MHHGVEAIRSARSRTSFVLSTAQRRERRLGLHGVFRTPAPRSSRTPGEAAYQPLCELRRAARGLVAEPLARRMGASMLPATGPRMRWTQMPRRARGHRISSSSPWRA
jgi:hypothetical protein